MDIYSTSFNYPRLTVLSRSLPSSFDVGQDLRRPYDSAYVSQLQQTTPSCDFPNGLASDILPDTCQKVTMDAMQAHPCHITYTRAEHGRGWNFHVSGSYLQVMGARSMILRECSLQVRTTIKVLRNDILDNPGSAPTLKPEVRLRLDEIAEQANTNISVINPPISTSNTQGKGAPLHDRRGLETEKMCELLLVGTHDCVEVARVRLLVMLDELSGLHSECCEIDHKLHAIIAGRKRRSLQSVQEETGTNIYYPSPLHAALGSSNAPVPMAAPVVPGIAPPRHNNNVIWITGEFFGVQRARDMLFQISVTKVRSKTVMSRDIAILPRKLEWMMTDRMDELKSIMSDNATFIAFPAIGDQNSMVTVFGDNRVNIQRTIRSVMQLACQFYVASFWLLPTHYSVLMSPASINLAQIPTLLKRLALQSGAEVVFKSNCFEVHGLEDEVRAAIQCIVELDVVKGFHHEIRFQIELANDQREFIGGKKNGKINKIMQAANVKIKFETFNDHNFLIEVSGNDLGAVQGLTMLHDELPAEISFHIPEMHHKRIIGVGGKSIQRIMKKYGVYVKFSNAEELAALGGYMDVEDNVVARTPAKNAMNLDALKQAIMELVGPKDKDFIIETISVPRRYHRGLLGDKGILIHDIESKTNSRIRFPDRETGSDIVTIFGPESQVHITAAMLLELIPFEADMPVPYSAALGNFCGSSEFLGFCDNIKREFQVAISPSIRKSQSGLMSSSSGPSNMHECAFKFRCQKSNSDSLANVRDMLEEFLIEHNVQVYPAPNAHRRADSFADAFPHFDSKLLSSAASTESPDLSRSLLTDPGRRVRAAASSPNVQALFNNSSQNHFHPRSEQEADEFDGSPSSSFSPTLLDDTWMPLPSIASSLNVERSRAEDVLKRGSDSLLETKIKEQIAKPRSLTNRAQSLDLTFHLARITEISSKLTPPDSPTNSTYGTGGDVSPTTLTAPSFPSVYGPPSHVNSNSRLSGAGRFVVPERDSIEDVSQVVSHLHL